MSLYIVSCALCGGHPMEKIQESVDGATWHDGTGIARDDIDAFVASPHGECLRWIDAPCPRCEGRGEYEIETTPCKIF